MNLFVPIMLFGWVPLTVFFFFVCKPHHAVLFAVVGGCLFLPMAGYDWLGLPGYAKGTAIAIGLVVGGRLSGQRGRASFVWQRYDLPMLLWCLSPIATSLSNGLGLYDGLSASLSQGMVWGVPYLAGRIYFKGMDELRDLCLAIVIGGLLYLPLCLYEIRMSPQLSNIFYGFFPHSFAQHFRYGGYRPIVFMQHGLMVALWMAIATTVTFWLWRGGVIRHLKGISISLVVAALAITTVLCKSANGWFALALGCGSYFFCREGRSVRPLQGLLLAIPLYMVVRATGLISGKEIEAVAAYFVDPERVGSLGLRLLEEDLFSLKALHRPLLGWGGYNRGWPVDPDTGRELISMIDSLWLITFSTKGFVGLVSLVAAMLVGPWSVLRMANKKVRGADFSWTISVVLCLVVILFMIDSLFNGMVNPVYIVTSGALVGWYARQPAGGENDGQPIGNSRDHKRGISHEK